MNLDAPFPMKNLFALMAKEHLSRSFAWCNDRFVFLFASLIMKGEILARERRYAIRPSADLFRKDGLRPE
jgi:hypothetical protein